MIKISGLPVNITKSDLDELFLPYGTIIYVSIKNEPTESIARLELELDKNEEDAMKELNNTLWRDQYILYLDPIRGNGGTERDQPGGGGNQNQGGGDQNQGGGNQNK